MLPAPWPAPPLVGVPVGTPVTATTAAAPASTTGGTGAMLPAPWPAPPLVGVPVGTPVTATTAATPASTSSGTGATPPAPPASAPSGGVAGSSRIVAASHAAILEASSAAAAQTHARAQTSAMEMALRRLSRYRTAAKGSKVTEKALEDLASVIKFASHFEEAEPGLRMVVHLSGVTPGGELGWASIYGDGIYVDLDILRVFAIAHQFFRGRDLLVTTGPAANYPPARLAGKLHRDCVPPTPLACAASAPSVAYLKFMEATLAPQLDGVRPRRSVSSDSLAKLLARGRRRRQNQRAHRKTTVPEMPGVARH
eukprot:TRINITY_DN8639_c0_g1_i1.p1 TRINITY_DN8639_c0_g1~~TRINITY_DN8639_c0_g1_i1.p1  ORF type:complete len:329 (-),score=50.99 TRINITY_DN8639_c0_g1_i1:536-1468(-)